MKETRWVIVDTETDGLRGAVHALELCGQLMEGWEPVGKPFGMLLDHGVQVPAEAVAVHGYTREFLRERGHDPRAVHRAFREYAGDSPLVAHNLAFDWDTVLEPEWARLGIPQGGRRGFCALKLARRLVPECPSRRLEALKEYFGLTGHRSHRAGNDVLTVVELFQKVYRERLEAMGLDTWEAVAGFARSPDPPPLESCASLRLMSCQAGGVGGHGFLD